MYMLICSLLYSHIFVYVCVCMHDSHMDAYVFPPSFAHPLSMSDFTCCTWLTDEDSNNLYLLFGVANGSLQLMSLLHRRVVAVFDGMYVLSLSLSLS
jgi:hypothetical protein